MKYQNLTNYEMKIFNPDGELVRTIPPSGLVARIVTHSRLARKDVSGVEFYETSVLGEPYLQGDAGDKHPFPPMEAGTMYIVSPMVRSYMVRSYFERGDLCEPGRLFQNEKGELVGCVDLSR